MGIIYFVVILTKDDDINFFFNFVFNYIDVLYFPLLKAKL